MSLTNPPTGPNSNALSRSQSLKRSVQDAFAGTLLLLLLYGVLRTVGSIAVFLIVTLLYGV